MGLFGKKKKKQLDDFSDEGDENGPGGKDDGGMPTFQGSDDNPYADDPAHKHFVKLLDSNGLVRHRRAFIRNSVYHVGQAKECDADRLQKIGVFLEADRKKLLRIFKDSEAVESEVDKQREQEKMDAERQNEEEEERDDEKSSKKKKKNKKDKKGKKDKKKKKKSKKEKFSDDEDMDDLGLSDEEEKPKKKKKKGKKGKKKDKEKDFDEDEGEEDEEEKGSKKKSKKGKKGKKKKKKDKKEGEMDDFDDFGEDIDEKPIKPKKSKGKKGKSKKDKKNKKSKKKKSENDLEMDGLDDELDMDMSSPEPQTDIDDIGMSEEELYTAQGAEIERLDEPQEETREVVIKEIEEDIKETEKKREKRMSHGSQALKLLNKKLGKGARRSSLASTNSRQKPRSVATVDEEEELWWKDLGTKDKSSTGRRISFTDDSYSEASVPMRKKKSKVKAQYGSNVEYLTDAEHEILQNYRTQRKVTRRQRPISQQYYAQSAMPAYNVAHLPPPMPPPIFKNTLGNKPETNLQPPGEAVRQQRSPPNSPNIQPNMMNTQPQVPPNPYQYYYPPPPPMPYLPVENRYYHHSEEEEEEGQSDGASTVDYSKYKYYKERYNKRKKEKKRRKLEAMKKQKRKQQRKRPTKERKRTKKDFVDVSNDLNKDSELWPVRSVGEYVNDSEINAESSDHESRVQRYGNDDYFFNYNNDEEERFVKKGRRGKNHKTSRINYFSAPSSGYESENNDSEMYILRKKLAEIGASRFYPILIKYGIMSLQHCTMSKLEKLPIASRSKKTALIRAIMQIKKGSKNRKSLLVSDIEFSDSSVKEVQPKNGKKSGKLGLKSSLKKRSLKEHQRKRKVGKSKGQSGKSRHYFTGGAVSLAESDNEPDHVKVVKKVENDESKSQDKKSVTFDLKDEDEISLPSYSDIEDNSDSELSVAFSD